MLEKIMKIELRLLYITSHVHTTLFVISLFTEEVTNAAWTLLTSLSSKYTTSG